VHLNWAPSFPDSFGHLTSNFPIQHHIVAYIAPIVTKLPTVHLPGSPPLSIYHLGVPLFKGSVHLDWAPTLLCSFGYHIYVFPVWFCAVVHAAPILTQILSVHPPGGSPVSASHFGSPIPWSSPFCDRAPFFSVDFGALVTYLYLCLFYPFQPLLPRPSRPHIFILLPSMISVLSGVLVVTHPVFKFASMGLPGMFKLL
jgi:hypothetical protein